MNSMVHDANMVESAQLCFFLFALSSLVFSSRSSSSILLFVSLCLLDLRFLIVSPGYYLLLFPKYSGHISIWNILCIGLFPVAVVAVSIALTNCKGIVDDVHLVLSAIANNSMFNRSQMMRVAIGLDQIPVKVLGIVENVVGNIWSKVVQFRYWTSSGDYTSGLYYNSSPWVASPWWYLAAQMIPEYAEYFKYLLYGLQSLTSILVYCNIATINPTIGVHLTIFIVNYFRSDVSLVELWLTITLLLTHERVVTKMVNLPWIAVGLLVPTVLIPLYSQLWIVKGTVNANFVFFQCYCLWVFVGLGFVEFVRSFLASESGNR